MHIIYVLAKTGTAIMFGVVMVHAFSTLSPARWHGKHTYLFSVGYWIQLNSILFADHITFNNAYMKRAYTKQKMTNNNNNNKRKQVLYFRQSRSAFLHNNLYFEIQTYINVNSIKRYLVRFIQLS